MADGGLTVFAWCVLSLALAGVVKGMTGIGIPLVAISMLTVVLSVPEAVLLLPVPIVLANIWQALASGYFITACRRFWLLLFGVALGMSLGAGALRSFSESLLLALLGVLILAFSSTMLLDLRFHVPPRRESLIGLALGSLGGVLAGVSSILGPPIIMLLVSLRLPKEEFVGTIATVYLFAGVAMSVAYGTYGLLDVQGVAWSAAAAVPLFLGMALGTRIRRRVSEEAFRKMLMVLLMLVGINLLRRGLA